MNEFLSQFNMATVIAAVVVIVIAPWLISRIARQGTATAVTLFGLIAVGVVAAAVVHTSQTDKKPSKEIADDKSAKPGAGSIEPPRKEASAPTDRAPTSRSITERREEAQSQPAENSRSVTPRSAASDNELWDVVPVFYGTDRARKDAEKRIGYSEERGRRLEVGRALVTVPKIHKVPNIERPWVYKLPIIGVTIFSEKEDPAKHFTLRDLKNLSEDEFARLAKIRIDGAKNFVGQALVFVHGFNTTFDYALYRAAQLSYDLKYDSGSFVYSWPSNGSISPRDYTNDRESAEQAEQYLKKYLKLVATRSGAKSLTIIAHSMGNEVLLPVLESLRRDGNFNIKISQLIFAAPDVDRDTFAGIAKQIAGMSDGMTLYAANNDRALMVSESIWRGPRAGSIPPDLPPVVLPGIDTIDVSATETQYFTLGHSGYAEKKELLEDIRSLLSKGYQAPKDRIPTLEPVQTPAGTYWKFP
ncbi:MAG: alpha/beta hydrolase [Pseudomonadota bacterium]